MVVVVVNVVVVVDIHTPCVRVTRARTCLYPSKYTHPHVHPQPLTPEAACVDGLRDEVKNLVVRPIFVHGKHVHAKRDLRPGLVPVKQSPIIFH